MKELRYAQPVQAFILKWLRHIGPVTYIPIRYNPEALVSSFHHFAHTDGKIITLNPNKLRKRIDRMITYKLEIEPAIKYFKSQNPKITEDMIQFAAGSRFLNPAQNTTADLKLLIVVNTLKIMGCIPE